MTPSDREKLAEVMASGVIEGTGIDDLDAILITGDQIKAIEAAERAGWRFESPGGGWQPIETAPKDGTRVIVYAPERDGLNRIVCECAWHPDGGWCVDEFRFVTHWMPLPEPPKDPT